MNPISMPTRRRASLLMLLIVASVRVFAGVPDLEMSDHASSAHSMNVGFVTEHSYDVSHGDDAADGHCHNCCAHAPMAVSSTFPPAISKAAITTSVYSIQAISAPVFAHYRPPRA
jgi:hypothetical protein